MVDAVTRSWHRLCAAQCPVAFLVELIHIVSCVWNATTVAVVVVMAAAAAVAIAIALAIAMATAIAAALTIVIYLAVALAMAMVKSIRLSNIKLWSHILFQDFEPRFCSVFDLQPCLPLC